MSQRYVLYICDQHQSTLFARHSAIHEDPTIQGWEAFYQTRTATYNDVRIVSQVALLGIMHSIRKLFGPDTGDPVPQVYLMQIGDIAHRLDLWRGHWSTVLVGKLQDHQAPTSPAKKRTTENHKIIHSFPRKGVSIHYHFAKLYLYSHVFRGLHGSPIPSYFLDCASQAVQSATTTVNFLVTHADLQAVVAGMPPYLHSMTGFACMFLAKMAMIYRGDLIDRSMVIDAISRLIEIYRTAPVGKWHLMHLMANGLEKIVKTLSSTTASSPRAPSNPVPLATSAHPFTDLGDFRISDHGALEMDSSFLMDHNISMGASQLMYLSNGASPFDIDDLGPMFL
jgi:hypothetical protein